MAGTEGAMISGSYGLNDVPSALLKYDKDKDYAGMIVYIQREIAALTYLVRERLPKVQVTSHEPVLPEVTERGYKFYCTDAGPSGSSTVMTQTLILSDDDAKNLQRNDFLMVDGVYFNGTATWATTFTATTGPKEVIQVQSVGAAGSYASGKTNVVVTRGWGGTGDWNPCTDPDYILSCSYQLSSWRRFP